MKILHVYRTYFPDPPGGLQEAIRQISIATGSFGVENRVLTLSPNPFPREVQRYEALVTRCRSWLAPASCDIGSFEALKTFAELAKWSDVIHYHFPWPFADLLELVIRPKKPKIMTYHSDIYRQRLLKKIYKPLMQHMLKSMDVIVATSPAYASSSPVLSDTRHNERVQVIPLGIEERSYPTMEDKDFLCKIGIKPDQPYFLFVGVLRYYKGLRFLLEAAQFVNAPILIAGSGPEENSLKAHAKELGLRNVIFIGQISDVQKVTLLKRCLALVLPSIVRSEAFGVVLIEASIHCRPMITCEVGSGTSFANVNGETGLVVPPKDVNALAYAMNKMLNDRVLVENFGLASRKRYESLFSGPAMGNSYLNIYDKVVKSRP